MLQLKAIFSILLRRYEFELVDAPESYEDDFKQMVIQPKEPCRVRYRKRRISTAKTSEVQEQHVGATEEQEHCPFFKVSVDFDLCQGHATCMTEAPEIFHVNDAGELKILQENPSLDLLDKAKKAENYCPTKAIKIESH
jgi:sterol 14-demethylase